MRISKLLRNYPRVMAEYCVRYNSKAVPIRKMRDLEKHLTWANSFKDRVNKDNVDEIVEVELSKVFESILEDCGVFKLNEGGIDSFTKFVEGVVNNAK